MMDIKQAKQTVESNLAVGSFVLEGLEVASESIPQFLKGQQFANAISEVSLQDSTLTVKQCLPGNWEVPGITAGTLQNTEVDLVLTMGETILEPRLSLSGSLQILGLPRTMAISGTMSDPKSWMIDFSICTEQLPGITDIANLLGIPGVMENLTQLNVTLPAITTIRFGFNISTTGFSYIGLDGSLCFGDSELDVLCMFTPDLVILGKIPEGRQIWLSDLVAVLSLDPANFPQVKIADLAFSLHPASQSYSFEIALEGDWSFDFGDTTLALKRIGTEFNYAARTITAAMMGEIMVDETYLLLEARLDETGRWEFNGGLAEGSTIQLHSVIETFLPGSLALPSEVPDMGCGEVSVTFAPADGTFSFKASSADRWNIPVGVDGLSISNIDLNIEREKTDDNKSQIKGHIGGTLNIGAASFSVKYDFPGDFVLSGNIPSLHLSQLVQDLCGSEMVQGVPLPADVLNVELKDIAASIAPKEGELKFSAGSEYGKTEIQIKRTKDKTWGFTIGFMPPEQWKFSTIDSSLTVLDGMKFADTALILASGKDESFELATITTPRKDVAIQRGLNLFATLSMAGLGVDTLLNIDSLSVYCAIGSDLRSFILEAQIAGEFAVDKNIAFGDMKFCLQVKPPEFGVMLKGRLRAILDGSELNFIGGLGIQVTPPSFQARMLATMQGRWQDPCGARGVAIADLALDLGIAFPPIRPSIGIAGSLQIGNFIGAAAVKLDTANPGRSMVAVAFNELNLIGIFDAFCPPEVKQVIPADIANTVLNVSFEDVKIYIVPQPTTIGELAFEQGIELQGRMNLWGLRAFGYLKIDQTRGILVKGDVDPIDIAGVFRLTGAGGKPKASLYLDLRTGATPTIEIYGAVQLLGIRSETILQVSDKKFYFLTTGKIFDLFEAALEVSGGDLTKGDTIFIKAAMRNDLFAYLREKATEAIEAAAREATRQLSEAQQQLTAAQNRINSLQREIDSTKARIDQLNREIADKQRWFDNLPWYKKAYRWAELSVYAASRYAEIGALYAKIGALEAAKHIAYGVLEVAKWALELVKLTVGAAAEAGKFIAEVGLGGLIDIREARFAGYLNATSGGRVALAVSLTFMNRPLDLAFDFDFSDPLSGAKDLAQKLLSM